MKKELVTKYIRKKPISEKEMNDLFLESTGNEIKKQKLNEELLCYSINLLKQFCFKNMVSFENMYNKVNENEFIELFNQFTNLKSFRIRLIIYFCSLKDSMLSERGEKVFNVSVYEYDRILRYYKDNNLSPDDAAITISERLNIPIEKVIYVLGGEAKL